MPFNLVALHKVWQDKIESKLLKKERVIGKIKQHWDRSSQELFGEGLRKDSTDSSTIPSISSSVKSAIRKQ